MAGGSDNGMRYKTSSELYFRIRLWQLVLLAFALVLNLIVFAGVVKAEDLWQITFYCHCGICNGKWPGVTATGHRLDDGIVACNILPIGTLVHIEDFGYRVVMDRGSKEYFDNQRHIDIYVADHEKALRMGVQYKKVRVIRRVAKE